MAGISEGVRLPKGKTKKDCNDLYENFVCMFGETIDADVILTVLECKNWNVEEAAEDLMKLQADFNEEAKKTKIRTSVSSSENDFATDSVCDKFSGCEGVKNSISDSRKAYSFNEKWTAQLEPKPSVCSDNRKSVDSTDSLGWRFNKNWSKQQFKTFDDVNEDNQSRYRGVKDDSSHDEKWNKSLDLTEALIDEKNTSKEDDVSDASEDDDVDEEEESSTDDDEENYEFDCEDMVVGMEKNNKRSICVTNKVVHNSSNHINGYGDDDDDDADVIIEEEKEFVIKDGDLNNGLINFDSLSLQFRSFSSSNTLQNESSTSYIARQHSLPFVVDFQKDKDEIKSKPKAKKNNKNSGKKSIDCGQYNVFFTNYNQAKTIKNDLNRITTLALNGVKVMVLMRGCPGSGKSYMANLIIKKINEIGLYESKLHYGAHIFSTDDYFKSKLGYYNFDKFKLPAAHEWNRDRVAKAIKLSRSPVIVDNTNTQVWEMKPYFVLGVEAGYHIEVVEPTTKWKYDLNELAKRNIHSVKKNQIKNMLERFESDITSKILFNLYNVHYKKKLKPPQPLPFLNLFEETKESKKGAKTKNKKQSLVSRVDFAQQQQLKPSSKVVHDKFSVEKNPKMMAMKTIDRSNFLRDNKPATEDIISSNVSRGKKYTIINAVSPPLSELNDNKNIELNKCISDLGSVVQNYSFLNELYGKLISDSTSQESQKIPEEVKNTEECIKRDSDICLNLDSKVNRNQNKDFGIDNDLRLEYVGPNELFFENYELAMSIKDNFERMFMLISNKVKILIILRGCPGSGKTFLAKQLIEKINDYSIFANKLKYKNHVLSADDYFISSSGYFFDRHKVSDAFVWNEKRCKLATDNNISPLIIDNCNGDIDSMKPYVEVAVKHGYIAEVIEPDTEWKFNEDELVKRNVHGVLRMKIRYMLDKYEKDFTREKLLKVLNLDYPPNNKPPQTCYDPFKGYAAFEREQRYIDDTDSCRNYEDILDAVNKNDKLSIYFTEAVESLQKQEIILPTDETNSDNHVINSVLDMSFEKHKTSSEESKDVEQIIIKTENQDDSAVCNSKSVVNKCSRIRLCPIYKSISHDFKNDFDRICVLVLCEVKVLVLLRGYFSTGKTCMVRSLIEKINNLQNSDLLPMIYFEHVFNDDNRRCSFMEYVNNSTYPSLQNQNRVETAMKNNITPIIIDGCNIKLTDMQPYVELAVSHGYVIEVLEPDTDWRFNEDELTKRNIFCSREEAQNWLRIYERNVNGYKLLEYFDLHYNPEVLPSIDESLYVSALKLMYPVNSELSTVEKDKKSLQVIFSDDCVEDDTKNKDFLVTPSVENFVSYENSLSLDLKYTTVLKEFENVLPCVATPKTVEDNADKVIDENLSASVSNCKDFMSMKISDFKLPSNKTTAFVERIDDGRIDKNKSAAVNSCREFILIKNSENIVSFDESKTIDEGALCKQNETSKVNAVNCVHKTSTDSNVGKHLISNSIGETLKINCSNISVNGKDSSEACLSDKNNSPFNSCQESLAKNTVSVNIGDDSKETSVYTTLGRELDKINVIDWLTENKKSSSEVDMKNINYANDCEKNQSYEFNSNWKPWEPSENSSEKKDNTEQNLQKPPRNLESQRKMDPHNLSAQLPVKPAKVPKEFLGWSTVPDPRSDWYGRVKDTISGTGSSDQTPKPPRFMNDDKSIQIESNVGDTSICGSAISRQSKLSSHAAIPKSLNEKNIHEGLVTLLRDSGSSSSTLIPNDEEITQNDDDDCGENKDKYNPGILSNMFPHVASIYLKDLIEKCHGDINWAAEILLEENHDESTFSEVPGSDSNQGSPENQGESIAFNLDNNTSNINEFCPDTDQSMKKVRKGMITKTKKFIKGNSIELKKLIEKNIVLNASSYSENILKLIKRRRGDILQNDTWELLPEEQVVMSDNIDLNLYNNDEAVASNLEYNEDDGSAVAGCSMDDDEGTIELTFSKDVIHKLNENFGSPGLPQHMFERDLSVELPKTLAIQLHCYIMDSLQLQMDDDYNQMEKMITEDEEFARHLQEIENGAQSKRNSAPNLQEIIDMETALAIYRADSEEEKRESNETFAARLGKSILLEKFPNIDQSALLELFSENRNSLHDTISALMLNEESEMNLNDWEKQLLEKAKLEGIKDYQLASRNETGYYDGGESNERIDSNQKAMKDWEYFREEAVKHHRERTDCFTKAKMAYNQGNKNVATYYSQLANLHLKQIEQANSKAAVALLSAHRRSSEVTLDLHFYQVKEAIEVLDLFLDSAINRLKEKPKSKVVLFIITGRGLHSSNGRSKLRPVVIEKLRSRQIAYSAVNPGMLRLVVRKTTPVSSSL